MCAVEDDLGNEEEMGEEVVGREGGLNGKQQYFLYFRLSPLMIKTISQNQAGLNTF